MACPEAVYLSYLLLFVELWSWKRRGLYDATVDASAVFQQHFQRIYLIFLFTSLLFAMLSKYNALPFFLDNRFVLTLVPYFYLTDSLAAVALAAAFIHSDISSAVLFLEVLSNFFMLSIISKTFSPSKAHESMVSQTSPSVNAANFLLR